MAVSFQASHALPVVLYWWQTVIAKGLKELIFRENDRVTNVLNAVMGLIRFLAMKTAGPDHLQLW